MASTPIRSPPFSPSRIKSKSKCIFLHEWWLANPQRQGLAVGGVAQGNRVFLSTVIAKTHEPNVVETEDGFTVVFSGLINAVRTSENGFPSEVCQKFLLGFPYDWTKYSAHSAEDEYINGNTGFDGSNASAHEAADETLPISVPDTSGISPQKKFCSGLGFSSGNSSKQFESTDNMESGNDMMTMEAVDKDNIGNLKGENGASNVAAVESGQSLIGESSERKGKKLIMNKSVEDAGSSCDRVATRSISKSTKLVKKDKKVNITRASISSPVRRSPRLLNRKKMNYL